MMNDTILVAALILVAVAFYLEWQRAQRRSDAREDRLLDYVDQENKHLRKRVEELTRTSDELTSMALQTTHPALREAQLGVRDGLSAGTRRKFDRRIEEQLVALDDDEYRGELEAEIAAEYERNPALDPDDLLARYFTAARTVT